MSLKFSFTNSLVTIAVTTIDWTISLLRFLRYLAFIPLTPLFVPLFSYLARSFLSVKIGREVVIHDWRFYARLLAHGEIGVGEMYAEGWWDIGSEDKSAMEAFIMKAGTNPCLNTIMRFSIFRLEKYLRWGLLNLQSRESPASLQYSLGAEEFFEKFLGKEAVCSVAHYTTGLETIEEAQYAKLKMIAEKLKLKEGMHVLDLGCGYGALARYLTVNYNVKIVGITNSESMASTARDRCINLDVSINCCDWRDVAGLYDRIVCIEMHEHVGRHNYSAFWGKIRKLLKQDGHFILQTFLSTFPGGHDSEFISKYMYGQLYAPRFGTLFKAAEEQFHLENYESMKRSAIFTFRELGRRFTGCKEDLITAFGSKMYRSGELALTALPGAFRAGLVDHGVFMFYPKEEWDTLSK